MQRPDIDWTQAPGWAQFWAMSSELKSAYWGRWGEPLAGKDRRYAIEDPRKEAAPDFGWTLDHDHVIERPTH